MAEGRTATQLIEGLLLEWEMDPRNPSIEFEFCKPYLKELPWFSESVVREFVNLLFVRVNANDDVDDIFSSGVDRGAFDDVALDASQGLSVYGFLELGYWGDAAELLAWFSWYNTTPIRNAVMTVHTLSGLYEALDDWGLRQVS